jgi:NADH-quinone oxidoreductase subunit A
VFEPYIALVLLILVVGGVGIAILILSRFIGKRNPTKEKLLPYECGNIPEEDARGKFPVKFFLVGILFIIFDIEVAFLFPWAVIYKELKLFGLIEMGIFLIILLIGYVYIVKKGGLKWE